MKTIACFVAAWITLSSFSLADFHWTTDRNEYLNILLSGAYTETFDESSIVLGKPIFAPLSFSGNGFNYTVQPTGETSNGDLFAVGTINDKWLSTEKERSLRFDFIGSNDQQLPRAFGGDFFFTNLSGAAINGQMTIVANGASGQIDSISVPVLPASFIGFYGSTPVTSFVLAPSTPALGSYVTVNNLTVGITAVPEPNTIMLLCAVTLAWGVSSKRARFFHRKHL